MKLSYLFSERNLLPNLQSTTKNDAMKELLDCLDLQHENISKDDILTALMEREKEQSTGIGENIAFPHARFPDLHKLHVAIGVSRNGIEFDALDHQPVNYVILMLVNRSKPNELLKVRAAISKFLIMDSIKTEIPKLNSPSAFNLLIKNSDIEVDYEITAEDIMRPAIASINASMSLYDAACLLHRYHTDSLPVIGENKLFIGEVSCFDLFSYGLPHFFNNLHVISFVKHMDPFEKYFKVDQEVTVKQFIEGKKRENPVISSDATLMEIVFEMTVKNKELLYVLNKEGRLIGVLDRYGIIDKILMTR